jgi:hypothetical protein
MKVNLEKEKAECNFNNLLNDDENIKLKAAKYFSWLAGGGKWNSDFKDWFSRNSNFSKRDLQKQIRKMMQDHNIPRSSRNFSRKYGRK